MNNPLPSATDHGYQSTSVEATSRAERLSAALAAHLRSSYLPDTRKVLRHFSASEAAQFLGTTPDNLRRAHSDGKIPEVETKQGSRRTYTAQEIQQFRALMEETAKRKGTYLRGRAPGDHLQVFSTVNFKGGSGKSTFSAHFAQHLALSGYRVLCIDLDPQGSLTSLFGYNPEVDFEESNTLYDAIRYDAPADMADCIYETYFHGLDIAPASLFLQTYEHETAKALGSNNTWNGEPVLPFYARLQAALSTVADDYDCVVIDTPPQLGFITMTGICCSTSLIVTVVPSMLDVCSMSAFLRMCGDLMEVVEEQAGSADLDWFKILVTRHEPNDAPQTQVVSFLRQLFPDDVLLHTMLKSTAISDAGITQETLYEVDRSKMTRSTYDRAMESLRGVMCEVEGLVQQAWGRDG